MEILSLVKLIGVAVFLAAVSLFLRAESAKAHCIPLDPKHAAHCLTPKVPTSPPSKVGKDMTPKANIYFQNQCQRPIRLALAYKDRNKAGTNNIWSKLKWWYFNRYEHSYLATGGKRILATGDDYKFTDVYYYAETTDGSGLQWRGDTNVDFDGVTLATRHNKLSKNNQGDFVLKITCN